MTASVVPNVTLDAHGVYSVSIAPGCRFIWWIEQEGDRERLWFRIDAPGLKHYETITVDQRMDTISFPIN